MNNNRSKIEADFAPERRADGIAALQKLDVALKDFQKSNNDNDKQVCSQR